MVNYPTMQWLRWSSSSLVKLTTRSGSQAVAVPTGRSVPACERVECGWPHGLCEHWTQIKGMEQRRREEVNCYGEGGRCANSDLHPWRLKEVWDRERETDRERYRTSISLIICLLMINPTMQCKRCHGLFEWEVVRLGCTSVLKAVYIFQVSKLLYKFNVRCLKDY